MNNEVAADSFTHRVETALKLVGDGWDDKARKVLADLYDSLLNLHKQGMNGLWARLLKNNFAPLTIGRFNFVVGNPPWVNWENLPDAYRVDTLSVWQRYDLLESEGLKTILGASKKDLSMLMTYTVSDTLLSTGGRLGFVITQSVFKTAGAGRQFRRLQIPVQGEDSVPLRVAHVDDMVSLNPFEGASNRTAVMVIDKWHAMRYPAPYSVWRKVKGARFSYDSTLAEVVATTSRLNFVAEPVDLKDRTSAWLTARPAAIKAVRRVLGKSDYEAHAGSYTGGTNAVYWVGLEKLRADKLAVVTNITEGAKIDVGQVTKPVEPSLLYPLLRPRDMSRWKAAASAFMILPHTVETGWRAIDEDKMQRDFPKAYAYFHLFKDVLLKRRSGWYQKAKDRLPFYIMLP